jgi:hypothetical protein
MSRRPRRNHTPSFKAKVALAAIKGDRKSRPQESAQGDKWSFCLTAGTLCPANQEKQ